MRRVKPPYIIVGHLSTHVFKSVIQPLGEERNAKKERVKELKEEVDWWYMKAEEYENEVAQLELELANEWSEESSEARCSLHSFHAILARYPASRRSSSQSCHHT